MLQPPLSALSFVLEDILKKKKNKKNKKEFAMWVYL